MICQQWRAVALAGRAWAISAGVAAGTVGGCLTVSGVAQCGLRSGLGWALPAAAFGDVLVMGCGLLAR